MTELQSLIRLQTWLSPVFPTGAFSYSHGLEAAIGNGFVSGKDDLKVWLLDMLSNGPGWNDAVLLAEGWRAAVSGDDLIGIAELAEAMSFSGTRQLETMSQGSAFLIASKPWSDIDLPADCPLPVAVGGMSGILGIDLEETLAVYLNTYVSNQIQAALRLMRLGQQRGVELLAGLEEAVIETSKRATASTLDDLGSNTVMADIAAIQHETLTSRIFRS